MSNYHSVIMVLALSDAVIVAGLFLTLRAQSSAGRTFRLRTCLALSPFIVHAIVFFEGTILYLQLTTIAIIYILALFVPPRRQVTDR